MENNGKDPNTNTTTDIPTPSLLPGAPAPKDDGKMLITVAGFAAAFGTGFLLCYLAYPREKIVPIIREVPIAVKNPTKELQPSWEISNYEIEQRVNSKITQLFRNSSGFFEVKDGESTFAPNRRAAVKTKTGHIDLKNNMTYLLFFYSVHDGTTRAVAYDGNQTLFRFMWHSGKTKPAATNPGAFRIPHGKVVEFGPP